jgi:hypothetical protein
LYVRNGVLPQEIIVEAKEQLKKEDKIQSILILKVGDTVVHPIWKKGKIIEVNKEISEYQIEFYDLNKIKPINFSFTGLKKFDTIEIFEDNFYPLLKTKGEIFWDDIEEWDNENVK